MKTIYGQPSWVVKNDQIELAVTETGGHMAPVVFFRNSEAPVQPYYVSPWQGKNVRTGLPVLDVLRGDFFCLPFGANNKYRGENHPVHGESAGSVWKFKRIDRKEGTTELRLGLTTKVRPGKITKRFLLRDGQNVIYCQHILEGFGGKMCLSHHATLAVAQQPGSLRVSLSPLRLGLVVPRANLTNTGNEYYFLAPGKRFASLNKIPTIWKDIPYEDCSSFPLRYGFMDLLAAYASVGKNPAWAAAAVPSGEYLWFSLKDPRVLPQTMFWMSNGGRQASPWCGINRCLGLEDGCAYFGQGLADSAKANELNREGIPTALALSSDRPTRINYIQGVARIPGSFDRVKSVRFGKEKLTFVSYSGKTAEAEVRLDFLYSGELGR